MCRLKESSGKATLEMAKDTGFPLFHSLIHALGVKDTLIRALVEVKRQLSEVASLLPLWKLQRSNSHHRA